MNEETLFDQALARVDPQERAAFLDQTCAGKPELRLALETLLADHERSRILGNNPPPDPVTPVATAAGDGGGAVTRAETASTTLQATTGAQPEQAGETVALKPGSADPEATAAPGEFTHNAETGSPPVNPPLDHRLRLDSGSVIAGRYTLQQKIGEGGMGEVWVAWQTAPVKRQVALKLIKPGMDSRAVLQRFEQERQALALMDHPNIARVLDGGMTATGQPFFVMELVNGLPLTKFCDDLKLSPHERLELFVPICQAAQHAHQKGIVHRDLKPANILVSLIDGKPVPKVIDFGVAKATAAAGKLTEESLATQFGSVVGTLEYMSPEQAGLSGEDIDTRSDIYSLGVILYELLTGLRPIDASRLRKAALNEMIRIIREEQPSKPSTRLSTAASLPSLAAVRQMEPRRLTALLRGELDWVVMKCLEKERDRRYETANGLARDIQRYLANEVVEARPPSAGYRLRKFAVRHRIQVAAAALVLLSLVLGMAGTTWGLIRAARANHALAAANTALATANADLTTANAKVQARYNLAVDAIKTFHTGVSEDFLIKQNQFKDLRDRLLKSAADFYGKLSALLGNETDFTSRRALAAANFELADLTDKVGQKEEALAAHRAVLQAREALAAQPMADVETSAEIGRSLTAIATLLEGIHTTDEAVAAYREAEALLAASVGSARFSTPVRAALADCRSRLGYLLYTTGQTGAGLEVLRQARSDQEVLADAAGSTLEARRELANTINRIANLLARTGRPAEADAEYRKALAIYQKLGDENPANIEIRRRLGIVYNNVGGLLLNMAGRLPEAEVAFRTALEIRQKLAADNPAVTDLRNDLALSHRNLGEVLNQMGRSAESQAEYQKSITLYQKLADDNPTVSEFRGNLADGHSSLGFVLYQTGRSPDAQAEFSIAMAIRRQLAADNPAVTKLQSDLARSHHNLGYVLSESGKPLEAEAEYRQAKLVYQKLIDRDPTVIGFRAELANNLMDLGVLLSETGRLAESEAEHRRTIALYQKLIEENPKVPNHRVGLAGSLYYLGDVVRTLGRPAEARQDYEQAIAIHERLVKESKNPWYRGLLAHSLRRRGLALRDLGEAAGAVADTRRALGLYDGLAARSGEEWFETACCHAALEGLAGRPGSGVSAAEVPEHVARQYGPAAQGGRPGLPQRQRIPDRIRAGAAS